MKIQKKNNIIILSTFLLISIFFVLFLQINKLNVHADAEFVNAKGASIRLTDGYGIRFKANISDSMYDEDAEYGMFIVPETWIEDVTSDYKTAFDNMHKDYIDLSCNPILQGSEYYIQGSIVSIKEKNIQMKFVGIAYSLKNGVYSYASLNDNHRSAYQVAKLCTEDQEAVLTDEQNQFLKTNYINKFENQCIFNYGTGTLKLNKDTSDTAYTNTSFLDLGEYPKGGYVSTRFTGKVAPQIGFFMENSTSSLVDKKQLGVLFSSDSTTGDYRIFYDSDPNSGAVFSGKWNKAAFESLKEDAEYQLVIGCLKSDKYYISMRLYNIVNNIPTLVDDGEYLTEYILNDDITTTGSKIIIFGSRLDNITSTIKVGKTLNEVITLENGSGDEEKEIITDKATYNKTTGEATLNQINKIGDEDTLVLSNCSYIDFGEYKNGGYVGIEFTGKYTPQIAFFIAGGTNEMTTSNYGGLMYSTDIIGSQYRVYNSTNLKSAILHDGVESEVEINKQRNGAAYNNLDVDGKYRMIAGAEKTDQGYKLTIQLYQKADDGYNLLTSYIKENYNGDFTISGNHIVLFGS